MLLCDHKPGHGLFVSRGGRETGLVSGRLPGGDRLAPSGCFTVCSLSLAGTLSKSSQPQKHWVDVRCSTKKTRPWQREGLWCDEVDSPLLAFWKDC